MGSGASLNTINEQIAHLNISEDLVANVREECMQLCEMV